MFSSISVAFPSQYPISVITSFNPKGDLRIDAWGIEFNGQRFRYKVESTELLEDFDAYLKFRCLYMDDGLLKSINLVFFLRDHRWATE